MVDTIDPPSTAHRANSRYETDFYAWTQAQAAALRALGQAATNAAVDWANVAEEIESLGRSDTRAVRSRIATIIEHLLKLEFSPADEPRHGWRQTVRRSRTTVRRLIADSPSLRHQVDEWVASEAVDAERAVRDDFADRGELTPEMERHLSARSHCVDEVLGDWFPPG